SAARIACVSAASGDLQIPRRSPRFARGLSSGSRAALQYLERSHFRRYGLLHRFQRLAVIVGLEAPDPVLGARIELELVRHRSSSRDQNAEVSTLIAVVARAGDAQEVRLALGFHGRPMVVETLVRHRAVGGLLPDAARRRLGNDVNVVLRVLDNDLA